MDRRTRALAFVLLTACGGTATPTPATPAAHAGLAVGDYVVYRFAGRAVGPEPMLLMEEVVSIDGGHVVVEDTLSRGHETLRAWRETWSDPLERRVEALCEISGETCTPLANEGGADLARLREGLFVPADGAPTDVAVTDESVDVGGAEMTCHVTRAAITVGGEARTTKDVDCPDFPWRRAGQAVEMPDKRRVLFVTVESFG